MRGEVIEEARKHAILLAEEAERLRALVASHELNGDIKGAEMLLKKMERSLAALLGWDGKNGEILALVDTVDEAAQRLVDRRAQSADSEWDRSLRRLLLARRALFLRLGQAQLLDTLRSAFDQRIKDLHAQTSGARRSNKWQRTVLAVADKVCPKGAGGSSEDVVRKALLARDRRV